VKAKKLKAMTKNFKGWPSVSMHGAVKEGQEEGYTGALPDY